MAAEQWWEMVGRHSESRIANLVYSNFCGVMHTAGIRALTGCGQKTGGAFI